MIFQLYSKSVKIRHDAYVSNIYGIKIHAFVTMFTANWRTNFVYFMQIINVTHCEIAQQKLEWFNFIQLPLLLLSLLLLFADIMQRINNEKVYARSIEVWLTDLIHKVALFWSLKQEKKKKP